MEITSEEYLIRRLELAKEDMALAETYNTSKGPKAKSVVHNVGSLLHKIEENRRFMPKINKIFDKYKRSPIDIINANSSPRQYAFEKITTISEEDKNQFYFVIDEIVAFIKKYGVMNDISNISISTGDNSAVNVASNHSNAQQNLSSERDIAENINKLIIAIQVASEISTEEREEIIECLTDLKISVVNKTEYPKSAYRHLKKWTLEGLACAADIATVLGYFVKE